MGVNELLDGLRPANRAFAARYPGEPGDRQPLHTVYGGAHIFSSGTARKLGDLARASLATHAKDAATFGAALGIKPALQEVVYARVQKKLQEEPVEDFRVDFEDGFGYRPDAEEDEAAVHAARELAKGHAEGTLPAFFGFRVKSLTEELKHRAARTLEVFLRTLAEASGKAFPPRLLINLPKVTIPEQVSTFVKLLEHHERALKLPANSLRLEIMVEAPQALLALPAIADAAGPRLFAAHFGAYDYTSSCDVTAAAQTLDHPTCDFARHMMKTAFAGRPVFLADGATNVMPVGAQSDLVRRAWRLSFDHVMHALRHGFYQGWDLHPAQLPVRYAACYAFFLDGLSAATARLKGFMDKAAQATLLGDVFDDAATGQGLLNFFLRALNCGAITLDEVAPTGLSLAELQTRSFSRILAGRRRQP